MDSVGAGTGERISAGKGGTTWTSCREGWHG